MLLFLWCLCSHCLSSHPSAPIMACQLDFLVFFLLCPRCSSGYVCPTGMRAPPLESFCDGGDCSVRGGVTGSAAHLSPHPCPPHCSGPTGRPLHDGGFLIKSHTLAMKFLPLSSATLPRAFQFYSFPFFFVCFWSVNLCPHWLSWSSKNEPSPWGEGPAFSLCTQLWGIPLLMW